MGSMRGLCRRHRAQQLYFTRARNLTEAWLIRNGKLLPDATGIPAEAPPPVLPSTSLRGLEKLWLFGLLHVKNEASVPTASTP